MVQEELVDKRWHRAEKTAWLLQMVPFVRFIALTGSLAYGTVKESSDIDVFIITKKGRIWLTRAWSTLLLRIIGKYRTETRRAGMICPNRFVTDDYLLIQPENRYHAQDYTQMVPLFDAGGMYDQFIGKNKWMEKYGFFKPRRAATLVYSPTLNGLRKIWEFILGGMLGDVLENIYRNYQLKRKKNKYPELNEQDSTIIANDKEIRIHPHPFK